MEEVFPDIYSIIVKHIPTDSFSTIKYISSSSNEQVRETMITNSSSQLIITQFKNKHDISARTEAYAHVHIKSISTCQPSSIHTRLYFRGKIGLIRRDSQNKDEQGDGKLFAVSWQAQTCPCDVYIVISKDDGQRPKEKSYRAFDFTDYRLGFWYEGYITLFEKSQAPKVVTFSDASRRSTMIMFTLEEFFGSGSNRNKFTFESFFGSGSTDTTSKAANNKIDRMKVSSNRKFVHTKARKSTMALSLYQTLILIIVVLVAMCCLTFLCNLSYLRLVRERLSTLITMERPKKKHKPTTKRRLILKYTTFKDWSKITSTEVVHRARPKTKRGTETTTVGSTSFLSKSTHHARSPPPRSRTTFSPPTLSRRRTL